LKVQQPKQPKLPIGTFVEVVADDKPQLKGQIGVIDDKDEHGNVVVRLFGSGTDTTLKSADVAKKTPKSANEALLGVVEHLHQESLQKQLKLSEYQSAPVTEDLLQSERDKIAVEAIAKYEQEKAKEQAALYEEMKAVALREVHATSDTALDDANAKIESSQETIQKLLQQLEDKKQLTQVIGDLQHQVEAQKLEILRLRQITEQNQQQKEQVVELQSTVHQTVSTFTFDMNNQETSAIVDGELNRRQSPQLKEIEQQNREVNKAKEISQIEFLRLKEELENSQQQKIKLVEENKILIKQIELMKLKYVAREKLEEYPLEKLENLLGKRHHSHKNSSTDSKPLAFTPRKKSV